MLVLAVPELLMHRPDYCAALVRCFHRWHRWDSAAGKSWCLNRMFFDICNLLLQQQQSMSHARLPILIYADVFIHRCGCSYVSYLKHLHGDSQGCYIASSAVRKGRAVLLVDGLEEAKKDVDVYR